MVNAEREGDSAPRQPYLQTPASRSTKANRVLGCPPFNVNRRQQHPARPERKRGEQGGHTWALSTPFYPSWYPLDPLTSCPKNTRTFSGSPRAVCPTDSHAKMQHPDLSLAMRIGLFDPLTRRSDGRRLIRNRLVFRAPSSVFFYCSLLPVGAGDVSQVAPDALISRCGQNCAEKSAGPATGGYIRNYRRRVAQRQETDLYLLIEQTYTCI